MKYTDEFIKKTIESAGYEFVDYERTKKWIYFNAKCLKCGINRHSRFDRLKDGCSPCSKRKYSCNEDFFATDTPESFYWAGFIAADGCVYSGGKNNKMLIIGLKRSDKVHLNKLKSAIEYTGEIRDDTRTINDKKYEASSLTITSFKIFYQLQRFNIFENKSLTYEFPEHLNSHDLISHFIRGYIDGDGCIFYKKPDRNRIVPQKSLSVLGTLNCLKNIKDVIFKNTDVEIAKIHKHKSIFEIRSGGNKKTEKILNFVYKNSNEEIRLDRKYNIAFAQEQGAENKPAC